MPFIHKKFIPKGVKYFIKQKVLYLRNSRGNEFGKRIRLSKDVVIGKHCRIDDDTILGRAVLLHDHVSIGRNAFIENCEIQEFSSIDAGVIFSGFGKGRIQIGKNCYLGIHAVLDWSQDIIIEDFVHIAGPSTGLWTHTSAPMCLASIPLAMKDEKYRPVAPIHIQNNVYIGGNCTIYPGVTIGHHSIIAPNSAVTKDVEPYTMMGGVPAREIKKIVLGHDTSPVGR